MMKHLGYIVLGFGILLLGVSIAILATLAVQNYGFVVVIIPAGIWFCWLIGFFVTEIRGEMR